MLRRVLLQTPQTSRGLARAFCSRPHQPTDGKENSKSPREKESEDLTKKNSHSSATQTEPDDYIISTKDYPVPNKQD